MNSMSMQTLLVPPVQRIICIAPPSHVHKTYPTPRTDYFVRLPDELLLLIFSLLEAGESPHEIKLTQWCPLTRVCRRWRDVLETLLYRTLLLKDRNPRIVKRWEADKTRLAKLLATLQKRPHLRYYTRSLNITVDDVAYSEDILRIMDLLPCVRQLRMHLDMKESSLLFLERVMKMDLQELEFFGYGAAPSLNLLFDIMRNIPTLRKLSTYRWGWSREGKTYTSFVHDDSASMTAEELSQLLPHKKQDTSALISLDLQDPKSSIDVTECLFRWPARLEKVSLTSLCYGPYERQYGVHNIQRLLSIHQETLRHITLGPIPPQGEEIPDLSDFRCLQELHLTLYKASSSGRETPFSVYRKIAVPFLCHLEIDLGNEREPHDQWIAEFLVLVRLGRRKFPPQTSLEWVEFKFCRFGDLAMGLARRSSMNCESVRHIIDGE